MPSVSASAAAKHAAKASPQRAWNGESSAMSAATRQLAATCSAPRRPSRACAVPRFAFSRYPQREATVPARKKLQRTRVGAPAARGENRGPDGGAPDGAREGHRARAMRRRGHPGVDEDREPQRRLSRNGKRWIRERDPRQEEERRKRRHEVVVDPRAHRLQEREEPGSRHENRHGERRDAPRREREDQDRTDSAERPVREEADPGLPRVPRKNRPAEGRAEDRGGRIAEGHHGPHRGRDRQVLPAEDQDQDEHDRGVRDDPRVAVPGRRAIEPAAEPRNDEQVEEQRGERAERGLLPGQPAEREREEAHPGVDRLALPLGGGDLHAAGISRPERYSASGSR